MPAHAPRPSIHARARGQALVEFALVAPVLLLLLLGLAQLGMIFQAQIGITNAAREDARRATTNPTPTCTWVLDEIKPASGTGLLAANVQGYQDGESAVTVTFSDEDTSTTPAYQTVAIHVSYTHPLFLPLIREILDAIDGAADGRYALSTDVEMRMETTHAGLAGQCQRP